MAKHTDIALGNHGRLFRRRVALSIARANQPSHTRCECALNHDEVGSHPAAHLPGACMESAGETLTSENGRVEFCPPCAEDARARGYRFELIDLEALLRHEPVACRRDDERTTLAGRRYKSAFVCPRCARVSWKDVRRMRRRRLKCNGVWLTERAVRRTVSHDR
jgi:hypothetical protein